MCLIPRVSTAICVFIQWISLPVNRWTECEGNTGGAIGATGIEGNECYVITLQLGFI